MIACYTTKCHNVFFTSEWQIYLPIKIRSFYVTIKKIIFCIWVQTYSFALNLLRLIRNMIIRSVTFSSIQLKGQVGFPDCVMSVLRFHPFSRTIIFAMVLRLLFFIYDILIILDKQWFTQLCIPWVIAYSSSQFEQMKVLNQSFKENYESARFLFTLTVTYAINDTALSYINFRIMIWLNEIIHVLSLCRNVKMHIERMKLCFQILDLPLDNRFFLWVWKV